MQPRTENARARRIVIPLFVLVALLSTVVRAAPAAAIDCQAAALSALGVADMTIDSATDVPAAAPIGLHALLYFAVTPRRPN